MSVKWSRICILLLALGIILASLGIILHSVAVMLIGCGVLIASAVLQLILLRCPFCGLVGMPLRWYEPREHHCPRCGKTVSPK